MLDDATVRDLCEKASHETDPQKAAELIAHVRALLEMENDETRLRMRQILLHYRSHSPMTTLIEKPRNSMSSFVAALIAGLRQSRP